jgi:superfamily II helicase
MNFFDLSTTVKDREMAIWFLQDKGVLHAQRNCSLDHEMTLALTGKERWRCYKRACREEIALRSNTWFTGSKLDFETAIFFVYSWSHEYTTLLSKVSFYIQIRTQKILAGR